ncbi:VOC family protein [Xylophilus rhododendri]|uniref:VOC family protein n=1 Tax=Xylophilus rhododendri TaxID=2697032 RepID=A0A857J301_9BURK|nr:VOC family protein [Xylophilus rhododendri]QHI97431.1 VOC family protein [Xylophilus rhododendri]
MKTQCTGTLNHLSLPTTNPAATAAFFQQHFGCEIVAVGQSILLQRDGFDIVLDHVQEPASWPSNFHFGFEMATLLEVQDLYETFRQAGVKMETEVFNNTRGSRFFCRTPEGVLIEVNTREDKEGGWRQLF